ncbi:MAG: acyl-CoA desaturase, partial [Gammaproteobacteria bacterium]
HRFGKKRYETNDDSKNNFILALLTLGEGWHNNHHRYPRSAKQGFFWWEIDLTYFILKFMKFTFLIKDLETVPSKLLSKHKYES